VDGRRWTRVADLRDAPPDSFAIEITPDGAGRFRLADGGRRPAVGDGAEMMLT
jgi:hypothetical protein